MTDVMYRLYARKLRARLAQGPVPRHIAIIMDGNRRWARQQGFDNVSIGHQHGAEHIEQVLEWCADLGINHVSVFLASIDNLARRSSEEVDYLMRILAEKVVPERLLQPTNRWRIHLAGHVDALPDSTAHALKKAVDATSERDFGLQLTLAIGYDGRQEIIDALRSILEENAGATLEEVAETLTMDDIAAHLYTAGIPDPDLVIRTSGEKRLSNFLLWQTANSELYFCDVFWPAFRHVDFLRAIRSYSRHCEARN